MQSLSKRLRREITANPKKAAILGLVFLVALYFWVPLVSGWLGLGKSGANALAKGAAAKGPDPNAAMLSGFSSALSGASVPQPAAPVAGAAKYGWQQVAEWIRSDPRSQPAPPLEKQRDPFQADEPKPQPVVVAARPTPKPPPAPKRYTPDSLALSLTGTVVGPKQRMAVINGRVYPEKSEIRIKADGTDVVFRVAEVQRQAVILTQGKETFNLKLKSVLAEGSVNRGSAGGL